MKILFRFIRTTSMKGPEGFQLALEIASHINEKYPSMKLQVFTELFGNFLSVYWMADFENMAAIEEMNSKLMLYEEYAAIVSKASDFFIEGSTKDTLVQLLG